MKIPGKKTVIMVGREFLVAGKKRGKELLVKRVEAPIIREVSPFSTTLDMEAFSQAWAQVERELSPAGRIILLLPENSFMITFLSLQQIPESTAEREKMVHFYMKKRFQGKGEISVASFYQGNGKFLVATTGKKALENFKQAFSGKKLKLKSIKPSSISALNYVLAKKGGGNFTFIFFLDGFAVLMGVKDGCLRVYRRVRPPFSEEDLTSELASIDSFLGFEAEKIYCEGEIQVSGGENFSEPCWRLPVLGELI